MKGPKRHWQDWKKTKTMTDFEAKIYGRKYCHFCGGIAYYDGKTVVQGNYSMIFGPWAYMCEHCFAHHGVGLGVGKGQKLIYTDIDD